MIQIYGITAFHTLSGWEYEIKTDNGILGGFIGEYALVNSSDLYELNEMLQQKELSQGDKEEIRWTFIKMFRDLNLDEDDFEIDYAEMLKNFHTFV